MGGKIVFAKNAKKKYRQAGLERRPWVFRIGRKRKTSSERGFETTFLTSRIDRPTADPKEGQCLFVFEPKLLTSRIQRRIWNVCHLREANFEKSSLYEFGCGASPFASDPEGCCVARVWHGSSPYDCLKDAPTFSAKMRKYPLRCTTFFAT